MEKIPPSHTQTIQGEEIMDKKKPEKVEETYFERQQDAWFNNDCQGDIEDYGYDEDFE